MNQYNLTALLVSVFVPPLLILLLYLANKRKEERYKQWINPLLALAYTVFCSIEFQRIDSWINQLLNHPYMNMVRQYLTNGTVLIYGFKLYYAILMNIIILLAFLLIKNGSRGITGIFARIFRKKLGKASQNHKESPSIQDITKMSDPAEATGIKGKLIRSMLNLFYHIDDATCRVRAKWLAIGKICGYTVFILCTVYILLTVFAQIPEFADFSWYPLGAVEQWIDTMYIYPAISAVLLLELIFFFNGKETIDMPLNVQLEKIEEKPFVDYTPLISQYEDLFPERYAGVLKAPTYPIVKEPFRTESEFAKALYKRLTYWEHQTNKKISKSVMDTVSSLPEGKNTLIDAQISDDFGECLMIYFNILLARGENLLVICRDEETCEIIRNYIEDSFKRVNGLMPVWIVQSLREAYAEGDCDVLVVTPDAITNETVIHAKARLFSQLSTVLLIDAARLASEISTLMMAVSEQITAVRGKDVQYIGICSSIPPELPSDMELILSPGREFRSCECFSSEDSSHIMLWNYEPSGEGNIKKAQDNLFGTGMDQVYLGLAVPLACVGIKYNVRQVSIMGKHLPAAQLQDALRLGNSMMGQFFSGGVSAEHVPERLQYRKITSEDPFIVVMDESRNLPKILRAYSRYIGRSSALVHVVSKAYMFRDYFSAHAGEYLLDKSKMDMFTMPLGDPIKNTAIRMIFDAGSRNGLSEDRLKNMMRLTSLRDALEECYSCVRNGEKCRAIEDYFAVTTRCSFNRNENQYEYKRWITLKQPGIQLLQELKGDVRPARLKVGAEEISLSIPHCNIYQYFLPDQAVIVNSRMYYINAIDSKNGLLLAGTRIDRLDVSIDYIQHRRYILDAANMRSERKVLAELSFGNAGEIRAENYEVELLRDVKITAETLGQIVPDPAFPVLDLTNRTRYRELSPRIQTDARRVHPKGSVMSIRFNGIKDTNEADRTAITLSVLMSELLKTLFPYNWQCIAVCPVLHSEKQDCGDGIPFENLALAFPQLAPSTQWECQPNTAEILIIEDCERDSGILDSLFRNRQDPLVNVFSIINDYLLWQSSFEPQENININGDYLKFGGDEIPAYFNLAFVQDMLQQFKTVHPTEIDPTATSNYCYFCHRDLRVIDHIMLYDENGKKDRKVCTDCAKRLLSRKEDLEPLVQQAKDYLCGTYGITLPKKIPVKFVSASKIAKQMKKKPRRFRYVGLAQSLTNTVWVETNSPKEFILRTLVHELTHIWQFENIKCSDQTVVEGHSSYMEVLSMRDMGYHALADETEASLRRRTNDEYGKGYVWLSKEMEGRSDPNPFNYMLENYGKPTRGNGKGRR